MTDARAPTPIHRRTFIRDVLVLVGVAVLLLLAFVAIRLAPLFLAPNEHRGVASIEQDASYREPALMREAWRQPVAALYARRPFEFQKNPSFCGPASAANVLHSLGDPRVQDQMLTDTPHRPRFGYLLGGVTLDQEADLLQRRTGRPVTVLRGLSLDEFRREMRAVNDPRRRYVANFHRGPLFGRGHGHFSPLLAYLPERDLVLVGDVNLDYKPFLVSTERLWRAVDTVDDAAGRARGLALVWVD